MRARWIVAVMALGLVSMVLVLEYAPPADGTLLARLAGAEPFHLVAHTLLYGSLAVALAVRWFPFGALDEPKRALRFRALSAAVFFLFIAGAQELAQAFARARLPAGEELFDLTVDTSAATLGLIAWSHFDLRRRYPVARALGLVLHPAFIAPLGVFALTWSALRDARTALVWTLLAIVAALLVGAVWFAGLRRGWFSDRDLSVRTERPGFLIAGLVASALFAAFALATGAPHVVRDLTLAGLIATSLVTMATLAGLKVSGHVAVPVGIVALLEASSHRGPFPFLLAAVAVSWARVREGRHTPREVLAGWGIASASGLFARWVV